MKFRELVNKACELVNKAGDKVLAGSVALVSAVPALATPPADPFTEAVGEVSSKVSEYGGALVGLAAVSVVFLVAIKYVKKIRGAA